MLFIYSYSVANSFAQNPSQAQDKSITSNSFWSFRNNPHPLYFEYSEQEKEKINLLRSQKNSCETILVTEYEIYTSRYPDIFKYGDEKTNFKNWKNHLAKELAKGEMLSIDSCLYLVPFYRLAQLTADEGFYYCGRYSRLPNTKTELEIIRQIDELVQYSEIGFSEAIVFFLIASNNKEFIKLNIDVEYYLRKFLEVHDDRKITSEDNTRFNSLISKEKIIFLNDAVKKRDFNIVLNATAPCE